MSEMPDKLSGVQAPYSTTSSIVSELELMIELELPVMSTSSNRLSFSESERWSLILKDDGREFNFLVILGLDS